MLGKLRGFSKSKLAGVLVGIIIIPFVFWGMGGVFSGGNTNNIAKINNENISTKDFVDYINSSNLNPEFIKQNIKNNILEELLTELVSKKMIDLEITDLKLSLSEKTLINKITTNKKFFDENNKFSRTEYEKFLLKNNLSAAEFESNYKKNELSKHLFSYVSGGIKSPYFLVNKTYIDNTKNINFDFIDLENVYKKNFTNEELEQFIEENNDVLQKEYIDFSYIKLDPQSLIQLNEFNEEFFKKIDQIENDVLNEKSIDKIKLDHNFETEDKINYFNENETDEILNEIYSKRNGDKIQLIDKSEYFLLFEIKKIEKKLPNKTDNNFIEQVKKNLLLKEKYDFNKSLLLKIQNKEFNENDFYGIVKNKDLIKNISIDSINDTSMFEINSVKLLYSLPKNSFLLISDTNNKIFLAKINDMKFKNISKNSEEISKFSDQTNVNMKTNLFNSYDNFLNKKYKIKINQKTLERVKNYFN